MIERKYLLVSTMTHARATNEKKHSIIYLIISWMLLIVHGTYFYDCLQEIIRFVCHTKHIMVLYRNFVHSFQNILEPWFTNYKINPSPPLKQIIHKSMKPNFDLGVQREFISWNSKFFILINLKIEFPEIRKGEIVGCWRHGCLRSNNTRKILDSCTSWFTKLHIPEAARHVFQLHVTPSPC